MNQINFLKFEEAKHLLQEGDVLLFRGNGIISNLIKIAGEGNYSHVAIASNIENGDWEAVEFREWFGGRTINLENYVLYSINKKTFIDVYRSIDFYSCLRFDPEKKEIISNRWKFNGKLVTKCMRKLTGLPYSYKRIWIILKIKLFKIHLLRNLERITNDLPTDEIIYPVCSTVVAHCFAINNCVLLKNKSDQWMEPSDISKSPRLNYLFTLLP